MATKEGYYGSDDTSNTFKGNGTNWFTLVNKKEGCLLYTSPSPRDRTRSRMPSSA